MSTMQTTVNRPVDPQLRDQDIENKLRLYGIYKGFHSGKVPTNKQIDVALNSFLNSRGIKTPSQRLSAEGQALVQDFRNVVQEAKALLLSKNHDQLLQDFIWRTEQLGIAGAPPGTAGKPNVPVTKDQAAKDYQDALEGLRKLGTLILSNGQFRKLLDDAMILFRDMAGDAATKAAGSVRPSEEQLSQIDTPAEENVWHEVPKFSKEDIKARFKRNKPITGDELREVTENAAVTAHPQGRADLRDTTQSALNDQRIGTESGVNAKGGVMEAYHDVRDRVQQQVPKEHQDRVKQQWGRTKSYLGEKVPEERRKQTIYRLKKMVVEIQGHEDYQKAVDTLLRLAENYQGHGGSLFREGQGQLKGAHEDNLLTQAEQDLKALIERFANYTSLDDLIESINDIYRDADRDPELKNWFRSMDSYIRRCLQEPGYIMTDNATNEWDKLYDHGRFLLRDRYRDHSDRVINEFKFIFEQFNEDPDSKRLGNSMQKLFTDLGTDENGKPVFKKHLLKDVSNVILPAILENIRYVPIPRIEYSDPTIDAVIENLVLESDNLMPNVFEIGNNSRFRWGRKSIANKHKQQISVHVSGIQCDLRDISYYIRKKTGLLKLTDKGVMDVFLGGDGLSFTLQLSSVDKGTDRAHFFKVEKVEVKLRNMKIKLKQSQHKLLFTLVKPLLLRIMKPVITKVMEKQIKDYFSRLDKLAYKIYQEQERTKALAKNDPEKAAQNIYARYYKAFQVELTRRKQKAKAAAQEAEKHTNIAVTKEDSMFKDISLPGGISTRATEYKSMAEKGENWQSDVFSIGSAPETARGYIPSPGQVTRKSPHAAHKASLRDRSDYGTMSSDYSRASRDSGYHANEPAFLGQHPVNQFDKKLAAGPQEEFGPQGSNLAGAYTLNAPLVREEMFPSAGPQGQELPVNQQPLPGTAGYYPTAF